MAGTRANSREPEGQPTGQTLNQVLDTVPEEQSRPKKRQRTVSSSSSDTSSSSDDDTAAGSAFLLAKNEHLESGERAVLKKLYRLCTKDILKLLKQVNENGNAILFDLRETFVEVKAEIKDFSKKYIKLVQNATSKI